jgi:hypothetical protein
VVRNDKMRAPEPARLARTTYPRAYPRVLRRVLMVSDGTGWNWKVPISEQIEYFGAPAATRTRDPRLRRPVLYPPELRAHIDVRWPDCTRSGAWLVRNGARGRSRESHGSPAPSGRSAKQGTERVTCRSRRALGRTAPSGAAPTDERCAPRRQATRRY